MYCPGGTPGRWNFVKFWRRDSRLIFPRVSFQKRPLDGWPVELKKKAYIGARELGAGLQRHQVAERLRYFILEKDD